MSHSVCYDSYGMIRNHPFSRVEKYPQQSIYPHSVKGGILCLISMNSKFKTAN